MAASNNYGHSPPALINVPSPEEGGDFELTLVFFDPLKQILKENTLLMYIPVPRVQRLNILN